METRFEGKDSVRSLAKTLTLGTRWRRRRGSIDAFWNLEARSDDRGGLEASYC